MVVEDRIVSKILSEQFRRFKEVHMPSFAISDEELDVAANHIGVRSLTDARTVVALHVFMKGIEGSAKYN